MCIPTMGHPSAFGHSPTVLLLFPQVDPRFGAAACEAIGPSRAVTESLQEKVDVDHGK